MLFQRRRKLKVSPGLYDRLVRASAKAGYASVDEMAVHVLEQAADRIETADLSSTYAEQIDKQLRGLGYLE